MSSQKINVADLAKKNNRVDEGKVRKTQAALRELRKRGVTKVTYGLGVPHERRLVRRSSKEERD